MPETLLAPLDVRDLGRMPYADAWALQRRLLEAIGEGVSPDTLLLVEHDPVITLGRKAGADANVLDAGAVPVLAIERGGDATYHGPGQLVGYPLIRLTDGERDLHRYLRNLEELVIRTLADFGLEGRRESGLTGVWVEGRKLASLGVAVRKWVTYHGLALNVSCDLGGFARLNPCGLESQVMASMATFLGREVPLAEVKARLLAHVPGTLGRLPREA